MNYVDLSDLLLTMSWPSKPSKINIIKFDTIAVNRIFVWDSLRLRIIECLH